MYVVPSPREADAKTVSIFGVPTEEATVVVPESGVDKSRTAGSERFPRLGKVVDADPKVVIDHLSNARIASSPRLSTSTVSN